MEALAEEIGLFDAHCHPTDIMASISEIANMRAKCLTVMASRSQDQELVADVASKYPLQNQDDLRDGHRRFVIPSYGWHPWFSYQLYDDVFGNQDMKPEAIEYYRKVLSPTPDDDHFVRTLPEPRSLAQFIHETETRLLSNPHALVGEVGIDRAFRLPVGPFHPPGQTTKKANDHQPEEYTPGSREGRPLTPYKVSIDQQLTVLQAQLDLAAKHQRPVSVHCVQGHGAIFEIFQCMWAGHEKLSKRQLKQRKSASNSHQDEDAMISDSQPKSQLPYPPRVCMHSFSGPADPLKQFFNPRVPLDFYFSFSHLINFSNPETNKAVPVVKAVPDDRILIESDYHCAGKDMDDYLLRVAKEVCKIKGWDLRDGILRLRRNWERFIFGQEGDILKITG